MVTEMEELNFPIGLYRDFAASKLLLENNTKQTAKRYIQPGIISDFNFSTINLISFKIASY